MLAHLAQCTSGLAQPHALGLYSSCSSSLHLAVLTCRAAGCWQHVPCVALVPALSVAVGVSVRVAAHPPCLAVYLSSAPRAPLPVSSYQSILPISSGTICSCSLHACMTVAAQACACPSAPVPSSLPLFTPVDSLHSARFAKGSCHLQRSAQAGVHGSCCGRWRDCLAMAAGRRKHNQVTL